jgi:hypothetical protein
MNSVLCKRSVPKNRCDLRAVFHAKDMNHAHRMDEKAVPDISENPSKLSQKKLVQQKRLS